MGIIYATHYKYQEIYLLFLSSLVGITFLIQSNDWILALLSWELINLSLYLIISINSKKDKSIAAAMKYFLLSA